MSLGKPAANILTADVKAGFLSTPAYSVVTYHANSSLVDRAKKGDVLKADFDKDLVAADTGAVKLDVARGIAYRLGLQAILVGNVEVKADSKANNAELTLDTQLINSTTGEVLHSAAVSGAAAGAPGVPLEAVLERAAQETALKVLPSMGIELVPLQASAPPPAASGNSKNHKASPSKKNDSDKKKSDKKKAEADKKAEQEVAREAERAAEEARKQAREKERLAKEAARQDEKNAERVRRDAEKAAERAAAQAKESAKTAAQPKESAKAPATRPTPADVSTAAVQDAQAAQPPATAQRSPDTVKGTSNAAGQPVPYGYAIGEQKQVLPPRSRNNIKVPAWLGVASFLAGVSFLL